MPTLLIPKHNPQVLKRVLLPERAQIPKIVVLMPAYRAERTLAKTLYAIPPRTVHKVIVVDDDSPDQTVAVASQLGLPVIMHKVNRGYGGNQKTCYDVALKEGAEIVVLLHPDYQYDPQVIPDLIAPLLSGKADFTFGSRFTNGQDPRLGGMPQIRYWGNRFTTHIENVFLETKFSELHSGLKAYRRNFLEEIPYHFYSDGFVFDSQMLIDAVLMGFRIQEISIPTRYAEDSSSASFKDSIIYILQTLAILFQKTLLGTNKSKNVA